MKHLFQLLLQLNSINSKLTVRDHKPAAKLSEVSVQAVMLLWLLPDFLQTHGLDKLRWQLTDFGTSACLDKAVKVHLSNRTEATLKL
ncbi:hypothetical protein Y1Q_0019725 [Alligator mississippiensis]|uniref:Uncharacterized protein n=1 Tax=Alligator mississippiensis TaxID=8496 RepID=A0A151PFR7_ALLMI|nr:hypothetical protein Y1Q_0019725 [Alligator mississippiensis]